MRTFFGIVIAVVIAATIWWTFPIQAKQQHDFDSIDPLAMTVRLADVELREQQPYDYESALAKVPPDHRSTLIMQTSAVFYRDRKRLADFALRYQIASRFVLREWVDAGGLLSYGASFPAIFRRAAEYVDKIAKGAKASRSAD